MAAVAGVWASTRDNAADVDQYSFHDHASRQRRGPGHGHLECYTQDVHVQALTARFTETYGERRQQCSFMYRTLSSSSSRVLQ